MKNNLPKVFKNTSKRKFNNNEKVYITKSENSEKNEIQEEPMINQNSHKHNQSNLNKIEEKLSKLINGNKHYTYKVPVKIEMQDKIITTKVIGRTRNYILTIDNEKIEIGKIKNITTIEK